MRNRAKCRICKSIIESFHQSDVVECNCGEISIWGGNYELGCGAKNFDNFYRIDDLDNEILVKVVGRQNQQPSADSASVIDRDEKIKMLEMMIKNIENLPTQAMSQPISHYDHLSFMLLVYSILKE